MKRIVAPGLVCAALGVVTTPADAQLPPPPTWSTTTPAPTTSTTTKTYTLTPSSATAPTLKLPGTTSTNTSPITPPPPRFQMGMNLARVAYYSSEWVFADAMKQASGWATVGSYKPQSWIIGDPNVWPMLSTGEVAQSIVFRDIKGRYPTGTYEITWEGQGDVWFGFDGRITEWGTNSLKANVPWPSDAGLAIRVNSSNPGNRVRNIKVKVPGAGSGTFDQRFLANIKPFYVLRFMDWQCTNNSTLVNWSDRTLPTHAIQTADTGVALEYMIELCNTLGADPWFCMPHLANDDFIRQFATMVLAKLNKDRKVYIEWSNEVWNDSFEQGQWALRESSKRGMIRPYVYADEAKRTFRIWHEVWGAQKGRVIRVAAGHEAVPWTAERIMERLNGEADAVSCAGYFYPMDADAALLNSTTTADQLLDMCMRQIKNEAIGLLKQHKTLADTWATRTGRPIQFVLYEGGQHLYTNTDLPWGKAGIDAQNHPKMAECYTTLLDACKAMDARVFMAFNSVMPTTKWGAWGALEYQDQPVSSSQKMTTLLKYTTRR